MASGDVIHVIEEYELSQKSGGAIKKQITTLDGTSIKSMDGQPDGKMSADQGEVSRAAGRSSTYGRPKTDPERKIGHRRVGEGGEITYKKIQTTQIMGAIQLGIQHTVGSLASKPKRDLLMMDFWEIETISFPPDGSSMTPAHHFSEFRFKIYAPIAFRYFRDLFGIQPDDFMMSMCSQSLRELSNPGASGSIFYLTSDDEFIIKTVQHKEGEFLQKLLPGYYMNLNQNPRTLLPKFFGLYCYQCNSKNVRLIAMNNLLPSYVKMHEKYDLKGSTYKRKASKSERSKSSPTYKDLDFMEIHPNGILLEADTYTALIRTIQRDCRVLESFKIMDYSLLVGIHNLDLALKERQEQKNESKNKPLQYDNESDLEDAPEADQFIAHERDREEREKIAGLNRSRSINRQRLVAHSTAMESIQAESEPIDDEDDVPPGGIPARSEKGERLLLFIGIIDILQSYRLKKKLEHTFKSIIHDGDTVSVHRPSFYATRFQDFMAKTVFKKIQSLDLPEVKGNHRKFRTFVSSYIALKQSPSKRKSISRIGQKSSTEISPQSNTKGPSIVKQVINSNASVKKPSAPSQPTHSTSSAGKPKPSSSGSSGGALAYVSGPQTSQTSVKPSSLPPLKKKTVTVKETIPPPVPPRGSSPRTSSRSVRMNVESKLEHLSTGSIPSTSSTPPPAFQEEAESLEMEYSTKDYISVSDIHLERNMDVLDYQHATRGALSWISPASAEGSTPTWTEELSYAASPSSTTNNGNNSKGFDNKKRNINNVELRMESI